MNEEHKKEITEMLNKLPFVRWDRFIDMIPMGECVKIYGWIAREDGKNDYVQVDFYPDTHIFYAGFSFTTSSKIYSKEIAAAFHGKETNHVDCERVELSFPGIINSIKLHDKN